MQMRLNIKCLRISNTCCSLRPYTCPACNTCAALTFRMREKRGKKKRKIRRKGTEMKKRRRRMKVWRKKRTRRKRRCW